MDASCEEQVQNVVNAARKDGGNVTIYNRFFLHSIDGNQEEKFFHALSQALVGGDKLYCEFRSKEDEALDKVHGKEHYRRYVDTPLLVENLTTKGFNVEYSITGQGMAKYKVEDPFVSRIIATKNM